ncbi:MAG: metallophosphoesterase [Clostridia bacterium]|nr:metallophosphoesterase [Clostridia bacterium]
MSQPFSFFLVTDIHYFEPALGAEGPAYERRSRVDQKCIAETGAIIDAEFARIAADTETNTVIIPGDLVFDGEKASHLGVLKRLQYLKDHGKRVLLITARHDYNDYSRGFVGEEQVEVEHTNREELPGLYHAYGWDDAINVYRDGFSYVSQLTDKIRMLALNCDGDTKDFKGLYPEQLAWAKEQIKKAHDDGCYIFAITHYPLLPGSNIMKLIGDAKLTDWEQTADFLADAGLDLIFTGHMHMQSLTEHVSPGGNKITDICTGSLVGCPAYYRRVTFMEDGRIDIQSIPTGEFAWKDKGDRTAAEYFQWRFDRMITDLVDAMADDFEFFANKFGGVEKMKKFKAPITFVGKGLKKWNIGTLGRLLCFKVDPSVKDRLLKDVGVEFVRNIFIGDEPYVKGTPIYDVMDKLLNRLKPVLAIAGKKIKGGVSADYLKDFVLSLIGDENRRDHTAVLETSAMQYLTK